MDARLFNGQNWRCIGKNSNISGFSYSGELFAFIGVGPTKSKLLLTISGGNQYSRTENIREGDNSNNLDMIYGNLTVLENLMFSAELRLQDPSDPSELAALRLLAEMGLNEMEDRYASQLPIWQRRILLFASEVIAGRDILFVDLPTADLDAPSALSMITALKRASRADRLVAITVSNLTFREYAVIDRIQLLSTNGFIYFGAGSSALAYFAALQRTPFAGESISDFLLDLVDDEFMPGFYKDIQKLERAAQRLSNTTATHRSLTARRIDNYGATTIEEGSHVSYALGAHAAGGAVPFPLSSERNRSFHSVTAAVIRFSLRQWAWLCTAVYSQYQTAVWLVDCECLESAEESCLTLQPPAVLKQFCLCFWRAAVVQFRDRSRVLAVYVVSGLLTPLLLLSIYLPLLQDRSGKEEDAVYNRLVFFSIFPFAAVLLCTLCSDDEKALFDRRMFSFERERHFYHTPVFPLATLLADILVLKLPPALFACAVVYPVVASHFSWTSLLWFLYLFSILLLTSSALEKAIHSAKNIFPWTRPMRVSALHALVLTVFLAFSGPFFKRSDIRGVGIGFFVQKASMFHWGCYLLFLNEFESNEYDSRLLLEQYGVQSLDPTTAHRALWAQSILMDSSIITIPISHLQQEVRLDAIIITITTVISSGLSYLGMKRFLSYSGWHMVSMNGILVCRPANPSHAALLPIFLTVGGLVLVSGWAHFILRRQNNNEQWMTLFLSQVAVFVGNGIIGPNKLLSGLFANAFEVLWLWSIVTII
eukprot:gene31421-40816_t